MLRYRILGVLDVSDGDLSIPIPSAHQRLLLSMLLLGAGQTVRSSSLIDELWGDQFPREPAAALRTQVSRLRHRLGPGAADLITDELGYRLRVHDGCLDALRFEELLADDRFDEALSLWRGPALVEFADRDFAQSTATRLEELMLSARERRAKASIEDDRPSDAISDLEMLVSGHRERDHARALLMEALYRTGRQTDALAVYDVWRRALADRGIEPDPSMVELERRILQHRVRLPTPTLPVPTSSFVGRHAELDALAATIAVARIVTLCGPGGAGKTRLALELAPLVASSFPDGIRFCDLSAFHRPAEVVRVISAAVGVRDFGPRAVGDRLLDQIIEKIHDQRLLLVIDNCEHMLGSVAPLIERVARHTTGITVLATSRERLGVEGEIVRTIETLDEPAAVQLYVDRACAVNATFEFDEPSVREICRLLDRLPLAIELAAACMRAVSPRQLLDSLADPLGMLTLGSRTNVRHGSLEAVINWSYERLSTKERAAFDRFGVFAGQVDADVASSVTESPPGVLLRLVDRSLLTAHPGNPSRYSMLETIRSFAVRRLAADGRHDSARDDHAARVVELVEQAATGLCGPHEARWASRLARHIDEIRSAHVWLVGRAPETALRLSAALHQWAFWRGRSDVFRMAEIAAAAGATTGSTLLTTVLASAAVGAWQRGDLHAAEAGALAAGTDRGAIEVLADVAFHRGDLTRARELFLDTAIRAEAAGDTLQAVWHRGSAALALHYGGHDPGDEPAAVRASAEASGSPSARALAHFVIGEIDGSDHDLRRAIDLATEVGSDFVRGIAEVSLASTTARQGDITSALHYYERAIRGWHQTGAWSPQWVTLRTFTRLLANLGMTEEATLLHGAATGPKHGPAPYGADAALTQATAARLLAQLGPASYEAKIRLGAALTEQAIVQLALDAIARASSSSNEEASREPIDSRAGRAKYSHAD